MKKLLSFILAITMIISLIPAAFAAGETDVSQNLEIVYDIDAMMTSYDPINDAESINFANTNNFWGYVKHYNHNRIAKYYVNELSTRFLRLNYKKPWYMIKINVPVSGVYTPSIESYKTSYSEESSKIYLIDKATAESLTGVSAESTTITKGIDLGTYDAKLKDGETAGLVALTGKPATFSAGDNYVVFYNPETITTSYFYISKFTLTAGTGETAPMITSYNEPTDIAIGGETNTAIETSAVLTDAATVSDAVVTYASSKDAIASVDANGKVTGLKNGTVTITATATSPKMGNCVTKTKEIKVGTGVEEEEPETPDGITVKYDFAVMNPDGTTLSDLTYSVTNGFWQYAANERGVTSINSATSGVYISVYENAPLVRSDGAKWFAVKLNVPKKDTYSIKLDCEATNASNCNVIPKVYLFDAKTSIEDGKIEANMLVTEEKIPARQRKEITFDAETLEEGEYYFVMCSSSDNGEKFPRLAFYNLTLTSGKNGLGTVPMWSYYIGKTALEIGETTSISLKATKNSDGSDYEGAVASYQSSNSDVASVSANGIITANKIGKATITATAGDVTKSVDITVDNVLVDENVSFMATSNVPNAVLVGTVKGTTFQKYYDADTALSIPGNTAMRVEALDMPGYNFVGWFLGSAEKGIFFHAVNAFNIRLVSNLCLTAVYEPVEDADDGASVDVAFYNGNGQLLSNSSVEKGTEFAAIAQPDMDKYALRGAKFLGKWSMANVGEISDSYKFNKDSKLVAQYEADSSAKYYVDVPDGMGVEDAYYEYDTKLVLNAGKDVTWLRNGKVVAYGSTYEYYVWGADNITIADATPADEQMPVITLTSDTDGDMIEWDKGASEFGASIVEVGILYNNLSSAKPTIGGFTSKAIVKEREDHGQFTVIGDGVARGYIAYKVGSLTRVIYTD